MDLDFARLKFGAAVVAMAQSPASLPDRLREAHDSELTHLRPEEHLPADLRPTFEELSRCLTAGQAAGDQGAAGASASPMTLEDAELAAGMLVDLHDEIVARRDRGTAAADLAKPPPGGSGSRLGLGLPSLGLALTSGAGAKGISLPADDRRPRGEVATLEEAMGEPGGENAELRSLAARFIKHLTDESSDEESLWLLMDIANSLAKTPAANLADIRYKLTATLAHLVEQLGEDDVGTELLSSALGDLEELNGNPGGRGWGAAL